ncbi:MAG: hypothetical protein AB1766_04435 [Pseudomonadota bacterium]
MNKFWAVVVLFGVLGVTAAQAALKPFVAGVPRAGSLEEVAAQLDIAASGAGFELVGRLAPGPEALVLAFTHPELKRQAAMTPRGGYGAVVRVGLTATPSGVVPVWTSLTYQAVAYRMGSALGGLSDAFDRAMGGGQPFGAEGFQEKDLAGYRYGFGMETFGESYDLGDYPSHEAAVRAIEANLARQAGGVGKVYRVDIPGTQQTVFGVSLHPENPHEANENWLLGRIDDGQQRRWAWLPYEILVRGNKAEALHLRYRLALFFPGIRMTGNGPNFMSLRDSPDAVQSVLRTASGGRLAANLDAPVWAQ